MYKLSRGVVAIPACNEGGSLNVFLPKLKAAIGRLEEREVTIVVVNDGSTDNTAEVVRDHGCQLITHERNLGLGVSLCDGYRYASGDDQFDFLVTMDADGQHDPELIESVLSKLEDNVDLVLASRFHPESRRHSPPLDRDLLNIAFASIIRACTGWEAITDPLTGFWGMRKWVAAFLAQHLKLERYGTCIEGLIKLWYLCRTRPKIEEIPHPAIYEGETMNRSYSPADLESRLDRHRDHTLHVIAALSDVAQAGLGTQIGESISDWRRRQLT